MSQINSLETSHLFTVGYDRKSAKRVLNWFSSFAVWLVREELS